MDLTAQVLAEMSLITEYRIFSNSKIGNSFKDLCAHLLCYNNNNNNRLLEDYLIENKDILSSYLEVNSTRVKKILDEINVKLNDTINNFSSNRNSSNRTNTESKTNSNSRTGSDSNSNSRKNSSSNSNSNSNFRTGSIEFHLRRLGFDVNDEITYKDIKKRYRKLTKKYHPDMETGDAETFKKIIESYEYLQKNYSKSNN